MKDFNFSQYSDEAYKLAISYGTTIIVSIIILLVGLWLIKKVSLGLKKIFELRNLDPTLRPFLISIVMVTLKILLVISIISYAGIPMTSFIAILGAAGLAVGMALSGTLQNFAGGVILLVLKPFKVGDYIEAQGYSGSVKEIQIFNTLLITPDNKSVIVPNGGLATGGIINYSKLETRRVDITFGIGYGDDIDKAKSIIRDIINKNELVLNDPEPFIAVIELGDSSVNIVTRTWAKTSDYWTLYFYLIENVKKAFDKEGITIPFPQRDVHVIKDL